MISKALRTVSGFLAASFVLSAPAHADIAGDEARVFALINAERKANGCAPLTVNARLTEAARRHSDAMAYQDFFAHDGPDGSTPARRTTAAGYRWMMVAENIAAGYMKPEIVVRGWMNSPGHRANILTCVLTETGIAVTYQADDKPLPGKEQAYRTYWVQVFGKPMR